MYVCNKMPLLSDHYSPHPYLARLTSS